MFIWVGWISPSPLLLGKIYLWRYGVVVIATVHHHSSKLNTGSGQVHILLVACWRFAMVGNSGNGPGWKKGLTSFDQPYHKNHHYHHHHHHHHCSNRLHGIFATIPRCYSDLYPNDFFLCGPMLGSFPVECVHLTFYLNCFKSRANMHFLYLVSF